MPTDSVFIEKIGCFNFIFACLAHEFGFSSHFGFPTATATNRGSLARPPGANSVIHASLSDMAIYLSIRGVDPTILCMQPKCFFYELSRKAARLY